MADLNGDGNLDLLSGSWPGELFFFRGGPKRTFAAPEMLKDKAGEIINIGGGIRESADGITITGNATFENTPEGTFAVYRGKRIKNTPQKSIGITGSASVLQAADWDGDGDLDLVVGDIRGAVWLIPNEGSRTAYAFGKEQAVVAGGKPVNVGSRAGPCVADWDGDGRLDLLVGSETGSVTLYRNVGTRKAPKLAAGETLVPACAALTGGEVSSEARPGMRAKLCVADWNGDGLPDLLVGDYAMQKPDLPPPTAKEKAEQEAVRAQLEPLQRRFGELLAKVRGPARSTDPAEQKKVSEELSSVMKEMQALRAKLPSETETHGWVWLYARKAVRKAGG